MLIDNIIDILVCPVSGATLRRIGNKLVCDKSGLAYPIVDGIPILLESAAMHVIDIVDLDNS